MSLCNVVKVGVEKVFRALLIVRYSTISSTPNFSSLIFFGCYPSGSPYRILIDFCDLEMDHDLPVQVKIAHVPNTPTIKDVSEGRGREDGCINYRYVMAAKTGNC